MEAISEHLSLFLVSLDPQPVEVSCTFDIVNLLDCSKIISKGEVDHFACHVTSDSVGGRKVIGPAGGMGFLKICSVNDLATPENGFLREDGFFIIELRLGLVSSMVENFTIDADESTCISVVSKKADVASIGGHRAFQWKLRCLKEMDYADIITNDISTAQATW